MAEIIGTSGNDSILGTTGDDTIAGLGGDDTLRGEQGSDSLDGGDGADVLDGGSDIGVSDTLAGGDGNDTISGFGLGADVADAGDGDDRVVAELSDSTVSTLTLGAGADTIFIQTITAGAGRIVVTDFQAGAGGDKVDLSNILSSFLIGWNGSSNPFAAAEGFLQLRQDGADVVLEVDQDGGGDSWIEKVRFENTMLANFAAENLTPGYEPDGSAPTGQSITGTSSNDSLVGTIGNDTISGLGNSDTLLGDYGDDSLNGGSGSDRLFGGGGADTLVGGTLADTLHGEQGDDSLIGGNGDDSISGGDGLDTLSGGDGADNLDPGSEAGVADTVFGAGGNDTISGFGRGDDVGDSGDGDDRVNVLLDTDADVAALTLGAGVDTIFVQAADASNSRLVVSDFAAGAGGDLIDISTLLSSLISGWDGSSNPFASAQGFLRLREDGADVVLDVDFDGGGDSFIEKIRFANATLANFTADNFTPGYDPLTPGVNSAPQIGGDKALGVLNGSFVVITTADLAENDPDDSGSALTWTASNVTGGFLALASAPTIPVVTFSNADLEAGNVRFVHDGTPGHAASFDVVLADDDGATSGAPQTVSVTVNTNPVAQNDAVAVAEDGPAATGDLFADNGGGADADADGDPFTVTHVNGQTANVGAEIMLASGALLTVNSGGSYSYNANAAFEQLGVGETATDSFTYRIFDNFGGSDIATVTVTINGANDLPDARDDSVSASENGPAATGDLFADNGDGADSDVDGDSFFVQRVNGLVANVGTQITLASGALLTVNSDGSYSYDANGAFEHLGVGETGTDSFIYRVSDGAGGFDDATVTVAIGGANDLPDARDDSVSASEDGPAATGDLFADNGDGADSDVDGDSFFVQRVNGLVANVGTQITLASGALLTVYSDGSYSYDANGAFEHLGVGETGTDSFVYRVSDGAGGFDDATVTVAIDGANDAPIANDDFISVVENAVVSGSALADNGAGADVDPDANDVLSVAKANGSSGNVGVQITLSSGALLTVNADGSYAYDPNGAFNFLLAGQSASDSFTYELSDGNGGVDAATVTVTIDGDNGVATPNADHLGGTNSADTIDGLSGADTIIALDGDDLVFGGSGGDQIDAGSGGDTVRGGTSRDTIFGGVGADSLLGEGGNDTIEGGEGGDFLHGLGGYDLIFGGAGDDVIKGGALSDHLFGEAGNDTFIFARTSNVDIIHDFTAGSGPGDVIRIVGLGSAFNTFVEVLAAAADNGADTTIDFGGGNVLVLRGVLVSQLAADDFSFG
jgi:VCBS repeat-containing protein